MTDRMLQNRITKLKELEAQQKALEEQAEKIKAEIKAEMESRQAEELQAGTYIIRWKAIVSSKFDTKAFSAEHSKLYQQYLKAAESRRFTVVQN